MILLTSGAVDQIDIVVFEQILSMSIEFMAKGFDNSPRTARKTILCMLLRLMFCFDRARPAFARRLKRDRVSERYAITKKAHTKLPCLLCHDLSTSLPMPIAVANARLQYRAVVRGSGTEGHQYCAQGSFDPHHAANDLRTLLVRRFVITDRLTRQYSKLIVLVPKKNTGE